MKKNIFRCFFLLMTALLFCDSGVYRLWGLDFEFGGEVRSRFAFLHTESVDGDSSAGESALDLRGRLDLLVSTEDSPFYFNSLLQWGNVEFTDDELGFADYMDFEMKEVYLGYKASDLKVKAGIIDLNTPGGSVYDSDEWGLQIKYDFLEFATAKAFYSIADLTDDDGELISSEYRDHILFLGLEQDNYLDLDLWSMFYHGDSEDFLFNSWWLGLEAEKEFNDFKAEAGYTYNFGEVETDDISLSAYFARLKIEYEPDKRKHFFTRLHLSSASDGSPGTTGQFQTLDGEGTLDTDLGLLFGGSPYSSMAFFDNESVSIVDENLTNGEVGYDDPGLFVYEWGFIYDFSRVTALDLESEFVLGGANTGAFFDGDGYWDSLIGLEFDIHNRIEFSENLEFDFSLACMTAGNSFSEVYELNHDEGALNSGDLSFKADCLLKFSF